MKNPNKWIDITVTIQNGMVHWPGDPDIEISKLSDIEKGDGNNISFLKLSSHTGTHMDAPLHFINKGNTLDNMPLEAVIGEAKVIEIKDPESIKVSELEKYQIKKDDILLFKTLNSDYNWELEDFKKDFVFISTEAGHFLVDSGVKTVGVDYLSVGGFNKNGTEIHNILLGAGIWIIEGLKLKNIEPGNYEFVCLPLKFHNSDGAPARAAIRKI